MSIKVERIPVDQLTFTCPIEKKLRIGELELWKQFVNHDFNQIKSSNNLNSIYDNMKWRLVIKYIIKTTHDFDAARLVRDNHDYLFEFFRRYHSLKTIDVSKIKVDKSEKSAVMNSDVYKEFEWCFSTKLELVKILCFINQECEYDYVKHVIKDKMIILQKLEQDMNLLGIVHLEYEIMVEYKNSVCNLRIPKIEEGSFDLNERLLKADTKLLLFIVVNNIADERNFCVNRDGDVVVKTCFHSLTISTKSDKSFDQLMNYKNIVNELLMREDLDDCIDEYMALTLTGSQLRELDNLKKMRSERK